MRVSDDGLSCRSGLRAAALTGAPLLLSGCTGFASPAISLFGAYFPSWLACALVGVIGAVVARVLFVRIGIDAILPARLLVYACVAALIGFSVALSVYGR